MIEIENSVEEVEDKVEEISKVEGKENWKKKKKKIRKDK